MPNEDVRTPEDEQPARNVKEGGRFGEAPAGRPHLSPEIPNPAVQEADVRVPETQAGRMPENRAESVEDRKTGGPRHRPLEE